MGQNIKDTYNITLCFTISYMKQLSSVTRIQYPASAPITGLFSPPCLRQIRIIPAENTLTAKLGDHIIICDLSCVG